VALNSAWLTYAHPDLKSQWQALKQQSPLEALTKGAEAAAKTEGDFLEKVSKAITEPSRIYGERAELEKRLKTNILIYIKSSQLHGFGFETPRKLASIPVPIPQGAWAGRLDWTTGTLHFRGLDFVNIRLATNRYREEISGLAELKAPPQKKSGRPTIKSLVNNAFADLQERGLIDVCASALSHYPLVRQWIQNQDHDRNFNAKNLSDEGIRAHFSPLFKELKESRKQ
jgi:predicted metal-dependent hydrolase